MQDYKNLIGKTFGKLKVLAPYTKPVPGKSHQTNQKWICICQCGNHSIALQNNLVTGRTKSCGCRRFKSTGTMIDFWETLLTDNELSIEHGRHDNLVPVGDGSDIDWRYRKSLPSMFCGGGKRAPAKRQQD